MAQVNRISSFKSFTEVKNQEATMKLRETNNAKRQETVGKIGAILDEMGLTSLSELDEEKKQALINKMFGNVSEDEAEDIEDELNKLGEPEELEEGNAFIYAAAKAKNAGKKTFQFNGKTYKVTLKTDTGLKEGSEFGEDEFEVDGETYEIEEAKRTKFTGKTANDLYTQIGGKPVEVFVGNDWYSVNPAELKGDKGDSFIGYTQDGSDHEFYLKDISFIQESVESIDEARSIAKIQYDWSKLTTSMQATAQNWKAAEGSAKEMLLGKLKEMTAQKKALEAELDATISDKDKDLELVVSEAFNRLPKDVIGNELYLASKNLANFYQNTSAGRDIDTGVIDTIIRNLEKVKKSVKKFNSKEEVAGTVYEGEVLLFDEIGTELEALKKKISGLMKSATDKKWVSALGAASSALSNLDRNLSQSDSKLGAIITEANLYEAKAKDLKPNHKYTSDYGEVTFIKLNPDGKTMKLHSKETGEIKTDISSAYNMELIESVVNEAEKFKSTEDFEEFLEEIDGMPEVRIKRIMGKDYIDTPGGFRDEADDYDNDIEEYTLSNMGRKEFDKLRTWWENNVQESLTEGQDPSAEKTSRAEQLKKLKAFKARQEETEKLKKLQAKRAKAAGSAKESVVVEGKDDYMARSGSADINIKKGYKHLVEYELEDLYNKLGALSKEYKIKGITATFESIVTEAEVSSDDEFKEYAMSVLKKAFGDDFDEAKAGEVVDGILKKCGDDYGAAVGMLTSSLGESVVTEAFDADKRVAELAKLLKKQKFVGSVYPEGDTIKVFVDSGDVGTTMMWDDDEPGKVRMECEDDSYSETIDDNDDVVLNFFSNLDDSVDESATNEAFDANYWEDYHEKSPKITSASKVANAVEDCVWDWNDNNENGKENEVSKTGEKKVMNLAYDFFKAKGYISFDIIDAMIAQES